MHFQEDSECPIKACRMVIILSEYILASVSHISFRYGYIHAIVSTSELSWYASVSRKTFWTSDFSNIIVSWSKDTSLKLILNEV